MRAGWVGEKKGPNTTFPLPACYFTQDLSTLRYTPSWTSKNCFLFSPILWCHIGCTFCLLLHSVCSFLGLPLSLFLSLFALYVLRFLISVWSVFLKAINNLPSSTLYPSHPQSSHPPFLMEKHHKPRATQTKNAVCHSNLLPCLHLI